MSDDNNRNFVYSMIVILFHAMVNFTGELIALNARADTISIGLWFVAAIGITVFWGAKTFTGKKNEKEIRA